MQKRALRNLSLSTHFLKRCPKKCTHIFSGIVKETCVVFSLIPPAKSRLEAEACWPASDQRSAEVLPLRRDVLLELHAGDLARMRKLEVGRGVPRGPEPRAQELREVRRGDGGIRPMKRALPHRMEGLIWQIVCFNYQVHLRMRRSRNLHTT